MAESRCGLQCSKCDFIKQCGCKGCLKSDGRPFYGDCSVALCCIEKGHSHCGECKEFPCELLNDYAYDPVNGDNGARIETIKSWMK